MQQEQLALEIQRVERVGYGSPGQPIPDATVAARVALRFEVAAAPAKPAGHEQRRARRVLEHVARIGESRRQRHGDGNHGGVVNRGPQTSGTRQLVGLSLGE